jgi:hypothetical protein
VVREVHQTPGPEEASCYDAPDIDSLAGVGDDPLLDEIHDDIRNDPTVHAEILVVLESATYGDWESPDAELNGRAIGYDPRDVPRDPHIDLVRLRVGHQDLVRIALRQYVDVPFGNQRIL